MKYFMHSKTRRLFNLASGGSVYVPVPNPCSGRHLQIIPWCELVLLFLVLVPNIPKAQDGVVQTAMHVHSQDYGAAIDELKEEIGDQAPSELNIEQFSQLAEALVAQHKSRDYESKAAEAEAGAEFEALMTKINEAELIKHVGGEAIALWAHLAYIQVHSGDVLDRQNLMYELYPELLGKDHTEDWVEQADYERIRAAYHIGGREMLLEFTNAYSEKYANVEGARVDSARFFEVAYKDKRRDPDVIDALLNFIGQFPESSHATAAKRMVLRQSKLHDNRENFIVYARRFGVEGNPEIVEQIIDNAWEICYRLELNSWSNPEMEILYSDLTRSMARNYLDITDPGNEITMRSLMISMTPKNKNVAILAETEYYFSVTPHSKRITTLDYARAQVRYATALLEKSPHNVYKAKIIVDDLLSNSHAMGPNIPRPGSLKLDADELNMRISTIIE